MLVLPARDEPEVAKYFRPSVVANRTQRIMVEPDPELPSLDFWTGVWSKTNQKRPSSSEPFHSRKLSSFQELFSRKTVCNYRREHVPILNWPLKQSPAIERFLDALSPNHTVFPTQANSSQVFNLDGVRYRLATHFARVELSWDAVWLEHQAKAFEIIYACVPRSYPRFIVERRLIWSEISFLPLPLDCRFASQPNFSLHSTICSQISEDARQL